jgi:mannose-6-phosphate isomerase-like protein (cupin superfamily)
MSDYTVAKVSDMPDQGPNFGLRPDQLEIRFLRNDLGCEHCGVSYARLGAGWKATRGHRHKRQEEIYLLVSGRAQCKVGDDIVDMDPWTAIRMPPETVRGLRAVGDEDAVFVLIGAPNTGPGDAEDVDDFWPE